MNSVILRRKEGNLRALLYNALDNGQKEEIFKISSELDKAVIKEMERISVSNSIQEKR